MMGRPGGSSHGPMSGLMDRDDDANKNTFRGIDFDEDEDEEEFGPGKGENIKEKKGKRSKGRKGRKKGKRRPGRPGDPNGPRKPGSMGMGGMGGMGKGPMRQPGPKVSVKAATKRLMAYLGKYNVIIAIILFIAVLSTAASIVGPKILGKATTKLFEGVIEEIKGTGTIDYDYIRDVLLLAAALYVGSMILNYLQGWWMAKITSDITYRLRRDISEKINKLPFKYFDGTTQGEVISRLTNDVDTLNQTLSQSISQIITSIVTVIGVLIMMFSISWQMTLVSLLILPLSAITVKNVVRKSQKYFRQQQDDLGHVNSHVEEMYGNHLVVKAFNGEEKNTKIFDRSNNSLYQAAWKAQFFSALMMPIMFFMGNASYVAVAILGGYLAFNNVISLGDIQAFTQYSRSFNRPLSQLANISNTLQQTAAASNRVFEFLEEEEEVEETSTPLSVEEIKGEVKFDHVKFGYNPNKIIIKDFSALAQSGKKIAIVGPTGAGKTTMVKLLMRFYDVLDGAILIDGHDIRDFKRHDLRSAFGMVLQDTWLYNDTIMENIRFGRIDATDEEVIKAAEAAHVDHFVHMLPGGYKMVLNEETTNISQGQRQLITIARAVLADPKILILDEATSSVDTLTEILIQRAMDSLMKNRTSFIIAHRLSTIKNADLILVMNEGDIVEQGTHDELLAAKGFYADLYQSQFVPED